MLPSSYVQTLTWSNGCSEWFAEPSASRCLHGIDVAELGINYENAPKASINTDILFRCLQRFDGMIGQNPGRRVLLFVDNASSHGTPMSLPPLPHTDLKILPKNTTPVLQPSDLCVIECVNSRYKIMVAEREVNLLDSGYLDDPTKSTPTWHECGYTTFGHACSTMLFTIAGLSLR